MNGNETPVTGNLDNGAFAGSSPAMRTNNSISPWLGIKHTGA
jgi:hypothetical protein